MENRGKDIAVDNARLSVVSVWQNVLLLREKVLFAEKELSFSSIFQMPSLVCLLVSS
jgi:hypothetical protein